MLNLLFSFFKLIFLSGGDDPSGGGDPDPPGGD